MPSSLLASPFVHSTVTIRVAVAHGQRLVRAGLRAILEREGEIAVVEAASGEEAVAVARRLRPNVVLLDVHLPGLGCVEATRQILAGPSVAVMVLTASETDARPGLCDAQGWRGRPAARSRRLACIDAVVANAVAVAGPSPEMV
jgi:DNA-binding NarL/FixJ family response regulator